MSRGRSAKIMAGRNPSCKPSVCYNCAMPRKDSMGKLGPVVLGGRGIAELLYVPLEHVGEFRLQSDQGAESFWPRLPCFVPQHEEDGWVLRISYGGWIIHGPSSKDYHAHLHVEAPSLRAFNNIVNQLEWVDECRHRRLPKTYPRDPQVDVMSFLTAFVPELNDKPFLEVVRMTDFAPRWRDALYVLGAALGVMPGVEDGAALSISYPWTHSTYTLRCSDGHDVPLHRFLSKTASEWKDVSIYRCHMDLDRGPLPSFAHWKYFPGGETAYWRTIGQCMNSRCEWQSSDKMQSGSVVAMASRPCSDDAMEHARKRIKVNSKLSC